MDDDPTDYYPSRSLRLRFAAMGPILYYPQRLCFGGQWLSRGELLKSFPLGKASIPIPQRYADSLLEATLGDRNYYTYTPPH